jgi:hypothetical protein
MEPTMKRLLLLIVLPLSACATPETKIVDTSCNWVKPIYVRKADKLSSPTATEILTHDDKWKQFCGDNK